MKLRTPVSAIMTYNLVKLNLSDDLTKAEGLFKKNKIRHIPVVDGDSIIGMLSYSDLLKVSLLEDLENDDSIQVVVSNIFKVEQVMTRNLVTVSPATTIREVAEILSKGDFHALPVVDDGILTGIVTTTDLLKYLINQY